MMRELFSKGVVKSVDAAKTSCADGLRRSPEGGLLDAGEMGMCVRHRPLVVGCSLLAARILCVTCVG